MGMPGHKLHETSPAPYPAGVYLKRMAWRLVWLTVWQLCWKRIYWLRPAVLRLFGCKAARLVNFSRSTWIEMPWQLSIGEYSALGPRVTLYNLGRLTIGKQTVLSQDVYVCGGTHDYTDPTFPLVRSAIEIGEHVWICAGAFIGPGVKIGDGAVIGARAVVTKDVEPWTVVAGNPAKFIKKREIKPNQTKAN